MLGADAAESSFDLLAPLAATQQEQSVAADTVTLAGAEAPVAEPRVAVTLGGVRAVAENGTPSAHTLQLLSTPAGNTPAATGERRRTGSLLGLDTPRATLTVLPTEEDAAEPAAPTDEVVPAPQQEASALPASEPEPLVQRPEPLELPAAELSVREFRPISELTVDVAPPEGLMPTAEQGAEAPVTPTIALVDDNRRLGAWSSRGKQWAATNMRHRPLYFEQINLERYGYTVGECVQPLLSGAHFFLVVPALPYKIAVAPQDTCVYTLGHYRPGSCVPRRVHWPQCGDDGAGAVAEAAVALSLVFLIP